ncbi:MAG: hypothetical protein GX318_02700 [Clostridia bacterium]|nr:hypothetical protein [Clostridia bacterium]
MVAAFTLALPLNAWGSSNVETKTPKTGVEICKIKIPFVSNENTKRITIKYGDAKKHFHKFNEILPKLDKKAANIKVYKYNIGEKLKELSKNKISQKFTVDKKTYVKLIKLHNGWKTDQKPELKPEPKPQPSPKPDQNNGEESKPDEKDPHTPAAGLSAEEHKMIQLVNQERVSRGLTALEIDLNLVKTARMKSQDMITKNYFAHQSPTYGSPFDLIKSQGISYRTAGENLAGASTVDLAHNNLMNSPGHRANILNPNYTHIGIGVVNGGNYGNMFTQHFIGK